MKNTILIVDDKTINIDMLTDILCNDYITMAAVSGENAINLMERKTPDLVLLDVFMPGIGGFEVLKYIKESQRLSNIPVIFVTGEHDSYVEEKGLLLGAVDYIKKPYSTAVIRAKVRNHLELKVYRDGLELLVQERTKQLAASREAIIMGMSLMSESHDRVTGDHIERIKLLTRALTQKILEERPDMLAEDMANQIVLFSPLHDIGKVGIPDSILKKTGVLTPEEFNIMKMHTMGGAALLRKAEQVLTDDKSNGLDVAIEIAECHHERFDGTGYPHGLRGHDIPISARIVALVDVYDALRSSRPYKKALAHREAADIIMSGEKNTGFRHFDPGILEVFSIIHNSFESFYQTGD